MSEEQDNQKETKLGIQSSVLKINRTFDSTKIKHNFNQGRSKTVMVEVKKKRFGAKEHTKIESSEDLVQRDMQLHNTPENLTAGEFNSRLDAIRRASEQEKNDLKRKKLAEEESKLKQKEQELEVVVQEPIETTSEEEIVAIEEKIEEVVESSSEPSPTIISKEIADKYKNYSKKSVSKLHAPTQDDVIDTSKKVSKVELKSKYNDSRKLASKLNSLSDPDSDDDLEIIRPRSMSALRRQREKARRDSRNLQNQQAEKIIKDVILPESITVQELANRMSERVADVTKALMKLGMLVTANQEIDADTAELIIADFGHKVKRVTEGDVENILQFNDDPVSLESRPPVVTIMGHVDHGKTSLLDALRASDIALSEAGGITQHIGAYQITMESGDHITFIDTPGHEAFTAMRSRGAQATDIVILVVAADDGIMAQTIEALNHAKAAAVPIIVAINKIDKPGADPLRVKQELLQHGLVVEDLGGEVIVVEVSAKHKTNLDKLEEMILLQAELLGLKANYNAPASGIVIESKVNKNRGVITTLLVQRGTLKVGDLVVAGGSYGKVRIIHDDKGRSMNNATPSTPVEILGMDYAADAGEMFHVVEQEKQAREITEYRNQRKLILRSSANKRGTLEELFQKSGAAKMKELPIIIKADVQGSIEAIAGSLAKVVDEEIKTRIIHSAVGGINESDISLANASGAMIVGFNVRANNQARAQAESEGIEIRYYSIIYNLIDDVKSIMSGMLSPIIREEYIGHAEIRQVYNITKAGKIAGSYVLDGYISRGAGVRLLRDDVVIYEGKLKTLRRFKDDVKEVREGYECGIAFENYENIKEGDKVEVFKLVEEQRTL